MTRTDQGGDSNDYSFSRGGTDHYDGKCGEESWKKTVQGKAGKRYHIVSEEGTMMKARTSMVDP